MFIGLTSFAFSQNIETIIKSKPVKLTGGVGVDNVLYQASGIPERRNLPYQYYLTGNLNLILFTEFQLPFSFSFSNQRLSYRQPFNQQQFNQFGASPKYKWATAHLGWRNMVFSPYSLNGHTFYGAGIELTPGKFQISAMYGRFLKPVELDTTKSGSPTNPSFRRIGFGVNLKYEDKGNKYGISLFSSSDETSSLKNQPDSIGLTPEQNLVLDLAVKQKLTQKFQVEGEVANSMITKDVRVEEKSSESNSLGLIKENVTTVNYTAFKTGISYTVGKGKIGIGYERIPSGYRTHGAYYFNNDLRNITVNFAAPIFKNKINLSGNAGTQRNNLDGSKISTMKRFVCSANINWQPTDKINLGINYSNFQTYTNMRNQIPPINITNPYQNLDTLNYVQITQSVNGNANFILTSTDKRQQNIAWNGSAQKAADEQGNKKLPTGTTFYNTNLAYIYSIIPADLSFNLALNGNWNKAQSADTKIFGPTAGVAKSFFKKQFVTNLSYSYNKTTTNSKNSGNVGSLRFINTLVLKQKHNFTLSFVWLQRNVKGNIDPQNSFNEYTGRIGYSLRF